MKPLYNPSMLRFFLTFCAIVGVLFLLESAPGGQSLVAAPWTSALAKVSYELMAPFDPAVVAHGNVLQNKASGQGISIEAGCNGIEANIVLIAAILAFPCRWRHKPRGLAFGLVAIQGLNIARVISLYYLVQWRADIFEFTHLYLWQALLMLDVLVVWLIWVHGMKEAPPRPA